MRNVALFPRRPQTRAIKGRGFITPERRRFPNLVQDASFEFPNWIQNGTFEFNLDGWVVGDGWTWDNGVARMAAAQAANSRLDQDGVIGGGRVYQSFFTIVERTAGSAQINKVNRTGTPRSTVGRHTQQYNNPSAGIIAVVANAGFIGAIDNVESYWINQFWVWGPGWGFDPANGGVATCDGTQTTTSELSQELGLVAGRDYDVTFTIKTRTAGSVTPDAAGTNGTARSAAGTYTQRLTAGQGGSIIFRASADFVGSIDLIEVRQAA